MVLVWGGRAQRTLKLVGRSPGRSPGSSAGPPPPHRCQRSSLPTVVGELSDEPGNGRHARPAPAILLLAKLAPRRLARAVGNPQERGETQETGKLSSCSQHAHQRPIVVDVTTGSEHFAAAGAARPGVRATASDVGIGRAVAAGAVGNPQEHGRRARDPPRGKRPSQGRPACPAASTSTSASRQSHNALPTD